jgi:hypothetical protein
VEQSSSEMYFWSDIVKYITAQSKQSPIWRIIAQSGHPGCLASKVPPGGTLLNSQDVLYLHLKAPGKTFWQTEKKFFFSEMLITCTNHPTFFVCVLQSLPLLLKWNQTYITWISTYVEWNLIEILHDDFYVKPRYVTWISTYVEWNLIEIVHDYFYIHMYICTYLYVFIYIYRYTYVCTSINKRHLAIEFIVSCIRQNAIQTNYNT